MADTLPPNFPIPSESSIASYNFTDIAEGTGIIIYKGANTHQGAADTYVLTTSSIFSNDNLTTIAVPNGAPVKVLDLDFDIIFNLPQRIRGNALFNATIGTSARNTGVTTTYLIIKIRKWDGTTETEIANAQSESVVSTNAPTLSTVAVKIPMTSITHFKKGDTLRITAELWSGQDTEASTAVIYHDPANRTATGAATTVFSNYIPFVLNL